MLNRISLSSAVRVALISLALLAHGSASEFGFNYWPYRQASAVLFDRNWPEQKKAVAIDLDHQASLGSKVVRVMIWGWGHSGWVPGEPGAGTRFTADYDELTRNLPELLGMIVDRKMKVIMCFANSYIDRRDPVTKVNPWQTAYGLEGWDKFLADSTRWMNGIVTACERSAYAASVVYYDLQNEPSAHWADERMWAYLNHVYDHVPWPQGKRGISPMLNNAGQPGDHRKISDVDLMREHMGARTFDFIEFHSYPRDLAQHASNPRLADAEKKIRTVYPDARVVIGEFGSNTAVPSREKIQTDFFNEVARFVESTPSVAYHIHWTYWDRLMNIANQAWGVGYDPDSPKDVLGVMAAAHQPALNADLETVSPNGTPLHWEAGGSAKPVLGQAPNGASGLACARVEIPAREKGEAWLRSAPIASAPAAGRRLYANAYVRGNVEAITLEIQEFAPGGELLRRTNWPALSPSPSAWHNYLNRVGSRRVDLLDTTAAARIAIVARAEDSGFFEVDVVSVDIR